MMRKIYILSLFLVLAIFSYSNNVTWTGDSGKITIIYKVVDPLIVTVEQPEKLTVSANQKTFTYSDMTKSKKPLLVTVKTTYNSGTVDDILRKIYEIVYFELEKTGKFELTNGTNPELITGQGYFIDSQANATKNTKLTAINKPFANNVGGDTFSTTTEIDVDFTLPDGEVPMGLYTGTLRLNVWFAGSLK